MNKYTIKGNETILTIVSNKYGKHQVLIDTSLLSKIKQITWHIMYNQGGMYYISGYNKETKKMIRLHRYVMNANQNQIVDHINRNTFDNRLKNLRFVNWTESNKNRSDKAYGHRKSNLGYKYLGLYKYKNNYLYDVHFPGYTRKRFNYIEDAKAYYLECLFNSKGRV